MMDWGGRGEHMTTAGWVFMLLGMLLLVALLATVVIWIVSQQRRSDGRPMPPGISARETLDHRLVSGEIAPEEYDRLRDKLESRPPPGISQAPTAS
jgi:uncharacterized membrane protein